MRFWVLSFYPNSRMSFNCYNIHHIMDKNYYEILWVQKTASNEEIKKAYRKLAMQHHPDRWGDANQFKAINEAYGVLWDPEKKQQYDTFWRVDGGSPFWGWFGMDVDLWDIFGEFFGGMGWSRRAKKTWAIRWEDIEVRLHIDLKTSIFWGKQEIHFKKSIVCDECDWIGWEGKKTCDTCGWGWYVKQRQQTIFGTIEHTAPCLKCQGSWEAFETICKKCHWEKRVHINHTQQIETPAGIDDGMVIKISGEWNEGIKSSHWDLYIHFDVKLQEKWLTRRGNDLYFALDIDVIEAILWTTKDIQIPILWKRSIKIEAGTQVGSIIKIPSDGVKYVERDKKWDLFVELHIEIPKKLSDQERECFMKIAQSKKLNVHNKKGILEKIFW